MTDKMDVLAKQILSVFSPDEHTEIKKQIGQIDVPLFSFLSSQQALHEVVLIGSCREIQKAMETFGSSTCSTGYWVFEITEEPETDEPTNLYSMYSSSEYIGVRFQRNKLVWEDISRLLKKWKQTSEFSGSYLDGIDLIYVDIHPHEGIEENRINQSLQESHYEGVVVFDDIWHFKTMRDTFWFHIPEKNKRDLTRVGHYSGTGLVFYNENKILNQWKWLPEPDDTIQNWTLVTAYFDLTKCPDASDEIRARDKNYYLHHGAATMAAPYPLVVFCDKENYAQIESMRPKHLKEKTEYVLCEFDQLRLSDNLTIREARPRIQENRRKIPYHFDPRNTASYYLFCMSRYVMMKKSIQSNTFRSSHFTWINFCMERIGYPNLIHLNEALSKNRDPFSTCYIDYIPESLVRNTAEYFQWGRCGMCSGFFTGNAEYMNKTCEAILQEFLALLLQGYGHADEQLFSRVYFDHPNLFQHYYGDYNQMITNYVQVYENPESILRNFIRNSFRSGEHVKCKEACDILWESWKNGHVEMDESLLKDLCYYLVMLQMNSATPSSLIGYK